MAPVLRERVGVDAHATRYLLKIAECDLDVVRFRRAGVVDLVCLTDLSPDAGVDSRGTVGAVLAQRA